MLPSELFHCERVRYFQILCFLGRPRTPRCVHLSPVPHPRSWPKSHSTLGGLTCLEVPVRCFPGESWKRIKYENPKSKPRFLQVNSSHGSVGKKMWAKRPHLHGPWVDPVECWNPGCTIRSPSPFQTFPNTLQGPSCRGCACIYPPWYPPCHRPDSALATANFHGRNTSEHILGSAACDGQTMEQICHADPSGFGLQGSKACLKNSSSGDVQDSWALG